MSGSVYKTPRTIVPSCIKLSKTRPSVSLTVVNMSPPAIAAGSTEVQVGANYKSDPSFYAPVDWKQNGIDLDKISGGVRYVSFPRTISLV